MTNHAPLKGRRILVVEDQYLLATEVCEWLVDAGAEVLGPVPDSLQARALIDAERPECAVIDINLGDGPVYDVANRLIERRVPFLFATGYGSRIVPEPYRDAPILQKPFSLQELRSTLARIGL